MVAEGTLLALYTRPAAMTEAGGHAAAFAMLPRHLAGLCCVAQGLYLHEHIADHYGVALADDRRAEVHLRRTSERLDRLLARAGWPLSAARPPAERLTAQLPALFSRVGSDAATCTRAMSACACRRLCSTPCSTAPKPGESTSGLLPTHRHHWRRSARPLPRIGCPTSSGLKTGLLPEPR
jgi:hypothetical protein